MSDEIAARLREDIDKSYHPFHQGEFIADLRALLDERERQIEHIAAQTQDIMTLVGKLVKTVDALHEIADRQPIASADMLRGFAKGAITQIEAFALLDERERQAEHIAKQAQDIMTLSAELARLREPTGEVGEVVAGLMDRVAGRKWMVDLDKDAADLITRQAAELRERALELVTVGGQAMDNHERAITAEASLREAVEVIGWIDAWVSNPVGSYSVSALSGLFSVTRERINAFLAKQEKTDG